MNKVFFVLGYSFRGLAIAALVGVGSGTFLAVVGDIVQLRGGDAFSGAVAGFCLAAAWLLYQKWWK